MAAFQEGLEALKLEIGQLRQQFESVAPKFGGYDEMLAKNGPWKAEVERMLLAQGAEQKDLIAKQTQMVTGLQDLYDKADTPIREINTKLLHNPGLQ